MDNKITLDPKRLDVVLLTSVRANSWNPKDKDTKEFEAIKKSIEVNGLRGFIVVRENPGTNPEVDKYEIIDGEQRWQACKELGFEKVIIYNEGKVEDKRAKELTFWWQTQVPFNELSLAKLVHSMIQEFGEVISPYTAEKIAEMQELAKFSFDDYKKNVTTPPPPTGELLKTLMVQMTASQYDVVQKALEKARKDAGSDVSDGRALEFVCIEFINTPEGTTGKN